MVILLSVLLAAALRVPTLDFLRDGPQGARRENEVTLRAAAVDLPGALRLLSEKAGVSAVTDGPSARERADLDVSGTLRDALKAIGDAFDLDAGLTREGVAVFRKRFADPATRPQMHLPELRQMAREITHLLKPLRSSDDPEAVRVGREALARSFTAGQVERLIAGDRLTVADLDPQQTALVQRIVTDHAVAGAYLECRNLLRALEGFDTAFIESAGASTSGGRRTVHLHVRLPGAWPQGLIVPLGPVALEGAAPEAKR